MFGYIKKNKVLKIINNGLDQFTDLELRVLNMTKEEREQDKEDYKRSINEINGAKRALQGLIKHFI